MAPATPCLEIINSLQLLGLTYIFEAQNTPSEPLLTPLIYGFSCRKLPKALLIQVLKDLIGSLDGVLMGQSGPLTLK